MANKFLIDPNEFLINGNYPNQQMPKYEDMHIFVELTSHGRERSVLYSSGVMTKLEDRSTKYGNETKTYNLLGSNENNQFTTNWYGDNKDKTNLEGFGIETIKITVNSSFIPQVDIRFADYRGRSFFNNDNSPYRMLFDFPPPIFKLTVKGYYGLGLTYLLHLVKYDTEFKSDNGFFYINANFVALTFAPLADIPFRYIIQFAALDGQTTDPNNITIPKNTLELILKVQSLYTNLAGQVKGLDKSAQLETISENINRITEAFLYINKMRDDTNINTNAIIFKLTKENVVEIFDNVPSFSEEIKSNSGKKLYVGFKISMIGSVEVNKDGFTQNLTNYQTKLLKLLNDAGVNLDTNSVPVLDGIFNDQPAPSTLQSKYVYLDLTKAYTDLSNKQQSERNNSKSISKELTSKINAMVEKNLGMLPTVYNIFKIILDDVDNFFKTLKDYSVLAEEHHNKSENLARIINDNSFKDKKNMQLYSFPLVINDTKKIRIAPTDLSLKTSEPFPELTLVDKFINSFVKVQNSINRQNSKDNKDGNGNNIWIPFTPKDSALNYSSKTDPFDGNTIPDNYFNTIINRFYVYKDAVYKDYKSNSNIKIYAEGEANNLANALLLGDKVSDTIKTTASDYNKDISKFYDHIETKFKSLYSINTNTITTSGEVYCLNKEDNNYTGGFGFDVTNKTVVPRTGSEPKSSFDKFFAGNQFLYTTSKSFKQFKNTVISSDNLLYVEDLGTDKTRYFEKLSNITNNSVALIDGLVVNGRETANNMGNGGFSSAKLETKEYDIYSEYAKQFLANRSIYTSVNTGNSTLDAHLKHLLILSCFGEVASPFNNITTKANSLFTVPSVIQTPKFVSKYMSMLSYMTYETPSDLQTIKDYFITGNGSNISTYGITILADLYDVQNSLSYTDNYLFIDNYNHTDMMREYNYLNNELTGIYNTNPTEDEFVNALKKSIYFTPYLFEKRNFLVYDDQTFKLINISEKTDNSLKYASIETMKTSDKDTLDLFFKTFFSKLYLLLDEKSKNKKDEIEVNKKMGGDADIINQTYYSFKTINDKWLSDPDVRNNGNNTGGYPFNLKGKKLIDSFAFVDRAMNPIGDTIINPEILGDMMNNPDLNVLSVLSSLLSLNHFEFFPLQNFMFDKQNLWGDSLFKITNDTIMDSTQNFTCMYIGGSSSYPSGLEQYGFFNDDGIMDLETEFNTETDNSKSESDINQTNNNAEFPWGKVKGFKVKFGEQNQSIFTDMKLDSKEYPETNESIQILSRLAGDNTHKEPAPKAQNLYNLYENRAYKATINAMGNAMIQPTQYFQLENVPMFNGAYMILGVEHNIANNRMTTSFTGTKILKYPIPRVLDAASIFGFGGGDSENTSQGDIPTGNDDLAIGNGINTQLLDTLDSSTIPANFVKFNTTPISGDTLNKISYVTGHRNVTTGSKDHKGIDIPLEINTPLRAIADGIIKMCRTDSKGVNDGYGYYMVIDHGTNYNGVNYFTNGTDHLFTLYAHLNGFKVKDGYRKTLYDRDNVTEGQHIANSGDSGIGRSKHLHFGMYQVNPNNIDSFPSNDWAINPKNYFNPSTKFYTLINNHGNNK